MWQLLILSLFQSVVLALGQVALKTALTDISTPLWTWRFWAELLTNWWLLLTGLLFLGASLLWMYIIKNYPFNMAYPMASLSYAISLVFAVVFFHETVAWNRWIGVGLIMAGCFVVSR